MIVFIITASLLSPVSPQVSGGRAQASGLSILAGPQPGQLLPEIGYAVRYDLSEPLLENQAETPVETDTVPPEDQAGTRPFLLLPKAAAALQAQADAALQAPLEGLQAQASMPPTQLNFDGLRNLNGVLPSDANGDVGPNHYVQWVNLSMAVWELDRSTRTATLVYGPRSGNAIWNGFGGACEIRNDGDPIVLYDHLADRWLISQFAIHGPYYQCIAVSQTGDPTKAWYRYQFEISAVKMNDYPHFGVWPDGYYLTINQFANGVKWAGAGVLAFERSKLLAGLPDARKIYFDLYNINSKFGGMLPADLDGPPPPPGTPNYFAEVDDSTWIGPADAMRIWEFHVDWNAPENSTFGLSGNPNAVLQISNFTPQCSSNSNCIPQPDPSPGVPAPRLDAIADRLMHRLQYRYFGSYATLVTNHTVDAGGSRAGVRWYEARHSGGGWSIFQQGTYAGDGASTEHRWMGSAAMDNVGNIAIGYSVSSAAVYPSIRYTGRLAGDPKGTLPQGENTLMAGAGSQTNSRSRWGDYSNLSVDPNDDCTFWFTSQYYQSTSDSAWRTRVGSFTFPNCLANAKGYLQGSVVDAKTQQPLENVRLEVAGYSTVTDSGGYYQFFGLPLGTYAVAAMLYGYEDAQVPGVEITVDSTTTLDFALSPIERLLVSGVVRDGSGQGWPLYARIDISSDGFASTVFSNPQDGTYQVELVPGGSHDFTVSAVVAGYQPEARAVFPGTSGDIQDFELAVDGQDCTAPGYAPENGCQPQPGGLLVGNVYDANTGEGINGASVTSQDKPGDNVTTQATPLDPNVDDGFFSLFSSLVGSRAFEASASHYAGTVKTVEVMDSVVVVQAFRLPAGRLAPSPASLEVSLAPGEILTRSLSLANSGTLDVEYTVSEAGAGLISPAGPGGPFAEPTRHISPKRLNDLNAEAVFSYFPPAAPVLEAGEVKSSWPSGLAHPWGIGLDLASGAVWLGDLAAGGGADRLHQYLAAGVSTGASIDNARPQTVFAADMAYDPYTGALWQVSVGGDNCLIEMDPGGQVLTGNRICPAFDNSQRGLAFNPLDGSFYSGSWINGILYHFDAWGTILDSTDLGLNISGLAFNPSSRRLFVLNNASHGFDVYVFDVDRHYELLGGFDIPGLEAYQQAGLEMDCDGDLWLVNQVTGDVMEVDSGEDGACTWDDVPWMSVSPLAGALQPGESQLLSLSFDANSASPGDNSAYLVISNDAPYGQVRIPITVKVRRYQVAVSPQIQVLYGNPGKSVYFTFLVTNNGDSTDYFRITSSGNSWSTDVPALIGPFEPGLTATIPIVVRIPVGTAGGSSDAVQLQLQSVGDPSKVVSLTLTTISRYLLFFPIH